jgi:hypothetical protein
MDFWAACALGNELAAISADAGGQAVRLELWQHAPELTPEGTLILYNDNNYAASPFNSQVPDQNNHSSAVEYAIDETNMEVPEAWNSWWQTNQDRLFTPYVGRVQ